MEIVWVYKKSSWLSQGQFRQDSLLATVMYNCCRSLKHGLKPYDNHSLRQCSIMERCVWSLGGSGSVIEDRLDHGETKVLMDPLWARNHQYPWCIMIWEILIWIIQKECTQSLGNFLHYGSSECCKIACDKVVLKRPNQVLLLGFLCFSCYHSKMVTLCVVV